jgi:dihydrofolate synthase/folylpolyglutamate synthase
VTETSTAILARIVASYHLPIDLRLAPALYNLLHSLDDPHEHLPPVLHVAGTNGKGSTCAFMRATLEAAGYRVHVYTSPHLVSFHERIRLNGKLITETALVALLREVESKCAPGTVSYFEFTTIAAMLAFARTPADFVILETGLGGRLDVTNVVAKPVATAITRISYDHREYLGTTLTAIAGEKAGIMKPGVPCCIGQQMAAEVTQCFARIAAEKETPLLRFGQDWHVTPNGNKGFRYSDRLGALDLPPPALVGAHQVINASLALATLRLGAGVALTSVQQAQGMTKVAWPARLQRLQQGTLVDLLPKGWELWLDGGHNDSAGEVLAQQAAQWQGHDGARPHPLHLIYGMLKSKKPEEFLQPLAPYITALRGVAIPNEVNSLPLADAVAAARKVGIHDTAPAIDLYQAVQNLAQIGAKPGRILICGSLYLAGHVLRQNDPGASY